MWLYTLAPKILNMSVTASVVIACVLLARFALRRAPKLFSYLLWAPVLFRLVCPVSLTAPFSLFGLLDVPAVSGRIAYIPADIVHTAYPRIELPLPGVSEALSSALPQGAEQLAADPLEAPAAALTVLWLCGFGAMLFYGAVSVVGLRRKLVGAVPLAGNVRLADHIASPFVLGFFRPNIYLPSALPAEERAYIICHERTHIRRGDHLIRFAAFLALAVHWFNPLVWLAFVLAGKDMEMSCDEAVMKKMGADIRSDYSASLLRLATGGGRITPSPLAFGGSDVKGRIKNVLRYKKTALWRAGLCLAAVAALGAAFVLNPKPNGNPLLGARYRVEEVCYDAPQYSFSRTVETAPLYTVSADYALFEKENFPDAQWEARGNLTPVSYTRRELYAFFDPLYNKAHALLDKVETIYRSDTGDDNGTFYLVMQTDTGEVLIAVGYDRQAKSHIRWLYRMEQVSGPYDADYLDASLVSRLSTQVQTFSLYETDTAPGYVIAGFLSGESGEMTDMGFAVFQFREGRYLLAECYVYPDAAVVRAGEAIDSRIYDGVLLAGHPAVCAEANYEVLMINHPQISAVTRTVDAMAGETAQLTACPAMLVFPWEDIDTREYHFTYTQAAEALPAPESSVDGTAPDSLTVVSGEKRVKAFRYDPSLAAPPEVEWLEIDTTAEEIGPFHLFDGEEETFARYSIADAETGERLSFMHPSGLAPQTYLLQNAESGRKYYVTLHAGFDTAVIRSGGAEETGSVSAEYIFGLIAP